MSSSTSTTISSSSYKGSNNKQQQQQQTYTPFHFRPNHGLIHPANRVNYDEPKTPRSSMSKTSMSDDQKSMYSMSSFDSVEIKHVTTTLDGRRVYLNKRERLVQGYRNWRKEQKQFWNVMGPYIAF